VNYALRGGPGIGMGVRDGSCQPRHNVTMSKHLLACGLLLGMAASGYATTPAPIPAAARGGPEPAWRSVAAYSVPEVELVRDDGKVVRLAEELADSRPVVLNFIYTSCNGICPLLSQTFSLLQSKLGARRDRVRLMSISIDPEQDTPQRLAAYARRFRAGPEWHHYTGTLAASLLVQRAFAVYRGDKMSHTPVTFLRPAPGMPWVRFDGFATTEELMGELQNRLAAP
jgi:protein SCO1/2